MCVFQHASIKREILTKFSLKYFPTSIIPSKHNMGIRLSGYSALWIVGLLGSRLCGFMLPENMLTGFRIIEPDPCD